MYSSFLLAPAPFGVPREPLSSRERLWCKYADSIFVEFRIQVMREQAPRTDPKRRMQACHTDRSEAVLSRAARVGPYGVSLRTDRITSLVLCEGNKQCGMKYVAPPNIAA